jgi:indolepyruvate ferredoxin oxidoreductase
MNLDDKYVRDSGRIILNGPQALTRLLIAQKRLDRAAGLNTAGFVSGYRGSPLGGVDQALWAAGKLLDAHDVRFLPGVNEDLAATAVWGTQQANMREADAVSRGRFDGVFAMWYGKGPGVERSGDAIKHANVFGTSARGGVLAIAGDDPLCKSSTAVHQSEFVFQAAMVPVLAPADIQDILDFGLAGWAMSRASGAWVGIKVVSDIVESTATVEVDPGRARFLAPEGVAVPRDGLHIRWPDLPLAQEERLLGFKLPMVRAFARANGLDRLVIDSARPRLTIVTAGKAYQDVRQALDLLGIDAAAADELGLRLYKLALIWPVDPEGLAAQCAGVEEVLVVEEKRGFIEAQIRDLLYNLRQGRPRIVGKHDENGASLLPEIAGLTIAGIATVILARLKALWGSERIAGLGAALVDTDGAKSPLSVDQMRRPHFCSGCPHNTSTIVPEGSVAGGGIGCHLMAMNMDRAIRGFTHMGGDGAQWAGEAPFSTDTHIFQNLGDGTYFHSGSLAIRQAIAANVNITFKILFNDAVAMTGGQPIDGTLTVPGLTRQMAAEGVEHIVILTDEPDRYRDVHDLAPETKVHHRRQLDPVQRELREIKGVSVLIFDQTCAAEKRRRRKRKLLPESTRRVVINDAVCEGCGDCSVQSNCLSVVPLDTEFGRKRQIDQASCNSDFSCLKGFCPSFVTVDVEEKHPSRTARPSLPDLALPEPALPQLEQPFNLLVTGIGGTGVTTVGAILAMAAHIEGKASSALDMTGLSQKAGPVMSHVRLGQTPGVLHSVRIPPSQADLLLGCDMVVAAGPEAMATLAKGRSAAIVSGAAVVTAAFVRDRDNAVPVGAIVRQLQQAVGADALHMIDAQGMAMALLGDTIGGNLLLLGFAYQLGLVPISAAAIEQAIGLNNVAVDFNLKAFAWGRHAAINRTAVDAAVEAGRGATPARLKLSRSLDEVIARRIADLTQYQNAACAARYQALVARMRDAELRVLPGQSVLTEAVARNLYKLIAYKDEYEVARLLTDPSFAASLKADYGDQPKLRFHLAPPFLPGTDAATGRPLKREFGRWIVPLLGLLARMKWLRGTMFDPFGHTAERRMERRLIADYEALVATLCDRLTPVNHDLALCLAQLPDAIRGYGPIKNAAVTQTRDQWARLLTAFTGTA